ncbi:MAG: DUF4091 domain-containing protein, partial [Armatimonadetes bacterium]|nr:DUF4091 domain-containing protein [Armatimonadota bacterium]
GLGTDTSWWATKSSLPLEANRLYRLSFWVKKDAQTVGGTAIAGLEAVNRDFPAEVTWSRKQFYFRTPDIAMSTALFRLGQWHVKGKLFFDDVTVTPALAVVKSSQGPSMELGEGESIVKGQYTASHPLSSVGSTNFRCLDRFTAHFNTNRWVFSGSQQVTYRHAVGRLRQEGPEVEVTVNLHERGSLRVLASSDGQMWAEIGTVDSEGTVAFPVPRELLPAREVWVRLIATADAALQVNGYTYGCRMPEAASVQEVTGSTSYLALTHTSPDLAVTVADLGELRPGAQRPVDMVLTNDGARRSFLVTLTIEKDGRVVDETETRFSLSPGGLRRALLPYVLSAAGEHVLRLQCVDAQTRQVLWAGETQFLVSPLYDASGGAVVHAQNGLTVWWCEPERKVSRGRAAPTDREEVVRIQAAGNEYEAVQVVCQAQSPIRGLVLRAGELGGPNGNRISADEVSLRTVAYVYTEVPTDELGAVDWWPDPLPTHDSPLDLEPNTNAPFWVTVHIPRGTPAGEYQGTLRAEWEGGHAEIPLLVHVWGFDLPDDTHLRSGFGLSSGGLRRYHNITDSDELRRLYQMYLKDFADHRLSPYDVGADIKVDWTREQGLGLWPKLDFAEFDRAANFAINTLGFNGFRLSLEGLGRGNFHSRRLGRIGPYEQGTPEHEASFTRYSQAVQRHLQEHGWLDEAYVYWFDEPEEKDYGFVREGMELIHRAAPKLTRMLTQHPDPRLYGAVDLWCLPTYTLTPTTMEGSGTADDEFWWYLCTQPKAPYFGLFLDHYGTELRVWPWASWKYGLDGVLVWQTVYWNSETAYPGASLQNPWEDPMSWKSGYGLSRGEREGWGNGDGRFLYPPNRDPGDDDTRYLSAPVPSIRWELLRDGMEDYEYLWLLQQEVDRLRKAGVAPEVYEHAAALLAVPAEVCNSLTEFATSPEPIHTHRAKVAAAIEELRGR